MAIERRFPDPSALTPDALDACLARMATSRALEPFSDASIAFAGALSAELFSRAPRHPELTALAFWLRPAAVARMRGEFERRYDTHTILSVPRGLALHLPPRNVDTLFVYSWVLSLLAGNNNVVRLSESLTPATRLVLDAVGRVATSEIRATNLFLSHPKSDCTLARISARCDLRIVWGGDAKVLEVRRVPLPPSAVELDFANRFSMAAMRASAVLELDAVARHELADRLYRDVYWFDQMACASPRMLCWVGDPHACRSASDLLLPDLAQRARERGYRVEVSTALRKLGHAHRSAIDLPLERWRSYGNELFVITLSELTDPRTDVEAGGVLFEAHLATLLDLVEFVRRSDQTLTHFGFDSADLRQLARGLNGRGIDRIVPVGDALGFDRIWDGYDLLAAMTRLVKIEGG